MGLLDEAIREHLELRRKHGADPSDVAREEHDALGPVERGEGAGQPALAHDEASPVGPDGDSPAQAPGEHAPEVMEAGQETVEIDMRQIFEADGPAEQGEWPVAEQVAATGSPVARASRDRTSWMAEGEEDLSAWDLPVRARRLGGVAAQRSSLGGEASARGSLP
jgi:hypothetical protein